MSESIPDPDANLQGSEPQGSKPQRSEPQGAEQVSKSGTDLFPDAPDNPKVLTQQPPGVLQCWGSGAIAAVMTWGIYTITTSIAQRFATHPFVTSNALALKISITVRTLVVGIFALGTAIFAIVSLGLLALGVQTLIRQLQGKVTV